ncbi:MAG: restriction endonuclease subunit S [Deltaproteobacteria bacterium]|nr:restriction endonuclease subunit S [Deltaproteobacteria bacterium]
MTTLGDLVTLQGGGTPARNVAEYWNGDIPWASVKDLNHPRLRSTEECISAAGVAASATNIIKAGHVVVATRMAVGRASLLEVDAAINQDLKALIPKPGKRVHASYLLHLLTAGAPFLEKRATGATVKGIRGEVLESLPVPHPYYEEQRRIADILDRADAIRRKRREGIALLDMLVRSAFVERFGDIPLRRSRWPFQPLRPFLSAASGKSSKAVLSPVETKIPVYGGNGVNGWATTALYHEPVVVVGRVGQQCGITRVTEGPAWVTDNAIVVTVTDPETIDSAYLASALQHSPLRSSVMRLDLPFINQATILDYPLPLPPVKLQREFSRLKSQLLRLHGPFRRGLEQAQLLCDSLAHRTFGAFEVT